MPEGWFVLPGDEGPLSHALASQGDRMQTARTCLEGLAGSVATRKGARGCLGSLPRESDLCLENTHLLTHIPLTSFSARFIKLLHRAPVVAAGFLSLFGAVVCFFCANNHHQSVSAYPVPRSVLDSFQIESFLMMMIQLILFWRSPVIAPARS